MGGRLAGEQIVNGDRITPIRCIGVTRNTKNNGGRGHTSTSRRKSKNSEGPSKGSRPRWSTPTNIRDFAAQANRVATQVLNGTIDLELARTYATIARVVAQSASIEVAKARFAKEMPDLSLKEPLPSTPGAKT